MEAIDYIRDNFKFIDLPPNGSTFITPEGKFVALREHGYNHANLFNEIKVSDCEDNTPLAFQEEGYIRCNDGTDNDYTYMEIYNNEPTEKQYDAIILWLNFVFERREQVKLIIDDGNSYIEYDYLMVQANCI